MSQGITLEKALEYFSNSLSAGGDCDRNELLLDKINSSIEYLLLEGGGDILREWVVLARDGSFTLPRDLGTPVKYRYGLTANSGYGVFNSAYHSYGSQGVRNVSGYQDWDRTFVINPSFSPVEFQPRGESRVVAITNNPRDIGKKIIVSGELRGKPTVPTHMGRKTGGEVLQIYGSDDPHKKYSSWKLEKITGIVKDKTESYVTLVALDDNGDWSFLSHIHPDDTSPLHRTVTCYNSAPYLSNVEYYIHILGRVDQTIRYTRKEDILPIQSIHMLELLATRAKYDDMGNYKELQIIEARLASLIRKTLVYQQATGKQMSFTLGGTGGDTIPNL